MKASSTCLTGLSLALFALAPAGRTLAVPPHKDGVRIGGHIPSTAVAFAQRIDRVSPTTRLSLALALPLRNQAQLEDLLQRVYNPADPMHGKYLTTKQFVARFSPTLEDYNRVVAFAQAQGLTIKARHANRLFLDIEAPANRVETTFDLHLQRYQDRSGRHFYSPDAEPRIPAELNGLVSAVIGLDNAAVLKPHYHVAGKPNAGIQPNTIGSGPLGGLTPSDIKTAYNLNHTLLNGSGETLALFELDGYYPRDISVYESAFGLPAVPLQNVLVDGSSGGVLNTRGAGEVTLDIELQIAIAPGARKILVYEGPGTYQGVLDTYSRIANDNQAREISTSWGNSEELFTAAFRNSENSLFMQMAAQGQSVFAASGDNGSDDNGVSLSVDDPASQPYMVGVGGTRLAVNSDHTFQSETTWNDSYGGGGGGISTFWSQPAYQIGVGSSSTMRNVPDVSLNADPDTGYAIYFNGGWSVFGGTSCAAPLWSALAALVNQQRASNLSPLGFANPALYAVAQANNYATSADFHDVADNSTNGFYAAVLGYDNATGWGSFNGAALISDLTRPLSTAYVSVGRDNNTRLMDVYRDGSISVRRISGNGSVLNDHYYGPFGGWTARAIATGPDNTSRILWTNTSGQVSIWTMDSNCTYTAHRYYGPYVGWTAQSISIGADGNLRLLWSYSNGEAALWMLDRASNFLNAHYYGPYANWMPNQIATGQDNNTRLLWINTDTSISLWNINAGGTMISFHVYGPYPNWSARSLSIGADNITRLLWDYSNGEIALWNLDSSFNLLQRAYYGPFTAWTGRNIATGPDNDTHVAWTNADSTTSLWTMDPRENYQSYHYYAP